MFNYSFYYKYRRDIEIKIIEDKYSRSLLFYYDGKYCHSGNKLCHVVQKKIGLTPRSSAWADELFIKENQMKVRDFFYSKPDYDSFSYNN